jgi:hypothetical protein
MIFIFLIMNRLKQLFMILTIIKFYLILFQSHNLELKHSHVNNLYWMELIGQAVLNN